MNRAAIVYRLWQLASWPEDWAYQRGDLQRSQRAILRRLLQRQAKTAFGRRHALHTVRTYDEFRERVPISPYETLTPYLPNGLTLEAARVWEPTGGSSGGSKWIPWTAALQSEFRRAVAVWIFHLLRQYPEVREGRAYWQLTPKTEVRAPEWLAASQAGFASDGDYLGPLGRWLERSILISIPAGPDLWLRTVKTLRQAQDLRMISCWSPSFLLCLHEHFVRIFGEWRPQHWWPELRLLSCWTQGPSAPYLERLNELFPGVAIQPKGLLSTEAFVTIPLRDRAALAYRSHFFELLDHSGAAPPWEWQEGQEGTIVVSTGGGLTRYPTGDRVRVSGFHKGVPCLDFLGREGVADQRGEKLAHSFVEPLLEQLPGFAMLGFEGDGYVLFCDQSVPAEQRRAQAETLERALGECYTYRDCRELGQLTPVRAFLIEGDALAQYGGARAALHFGQSEGSVKVQRLQSKPGWAHVFRGDYIP